LRAEETFETDELPKEKLPKAEAPLPKEEVEGMRDVLPKEKSFFVSSLLFPCWERKVVFVWPTSWEFNCRV
jgi:hypothetical protein